MTWSWLLIIGVVLIWVVLWFVLESQLIKDSKKLDDKAEKMYSDDYQDWMDD